MPALIEQPIEIAKDHYLLKIKHDAQLSNPGQFINVRVTQDTVPLLRRPFSIFDHNEDYIEIVIQVVGTGTEILSKATAGPIDILGPLGKGFTEVKDSTTLLIGGGVGNAPLYYLARNLKKNNNRVIYIYGSRSKEYMYLADKYEALSDRFIVTTDDGSCGRECFATDAGKEIVESETIDYIYTCGPTPMMRKAAELPGNIPTEISVENYFGCGIGLCVGCTVETSQGMKRACVEGPVFDGSLMLWDSLE